MDTWEFGITSQSEIICQCCKCRYPAELILKGQNGQQCPSTESVELMTCYRCTGHFDLTVKPITSRMEAKG
jgi:hypothetical protein